TRRLGERRLRQMENGGRRPTAPTRSLRDLEEANPVHFVTGSEQTSVRREAYGVDTALEAGKVTDQADPGPIIDAPQDHYCSVPGVIPVPGRCGKQPAVRREGDGHDALPAPFASILARAEAAPGVRIPEAHGAVSAPGGKQSVPGRKRHGHHGAGV